MSLTETDFCFSPSAFRKAASSKVSSGGGVRPRLAAFGFPWGARNDMKALYTNPDVVRLSLKCSFDGMANDEHCADRQCRWPEFAIFPGRAMQRPIFLSLHIPP